jgi:hypothetical protein
MRSKGCTPLSMPGRLLGVGGISNCQVRAGRGEGGGGMQRSTRAGQEGGGGLLAGREWHLKLPGRSAWG